jgi:hypothetical protein
LENDMDYKRPLDNLLAKDMDRRDFLKFMGSAAVSLVGISAVIRGFSGLTHTKRESGYGSSAYGASSKTSRE